MSTFKTRVDARDKIYSTLSVAPRKVAASININYHHSNPAADVYAKAIHAHAKITKRFELFHNCFVVKDFMVDASSWIPNFWSEVPGKTYIPAPFAATTSRAHYTLSYILPSPSKPDDRLRPYILRVRGVRCAEVSFVTEPLSPKLDTHEVMPFMQGWQPHDPSNICGPTNETMRKAHALTLRCNITKEREPDWLLSPAAMWTGQSSGD